MAIGQRKPRLSWAAGAALPLALAIFLAGCEGAPDEAKPVAFVEGFAGLVAADEPRATVVGRDILGNGGNAADAAVAMYFTMAVTLPSRAGLGGGGTCVIFDNGDRAGEALSFLPRTTAGGGLVPLNMRAMAALHARQGIVRWGELLAPAENLARFGHGVSRAFARDLAAAQGVLAADPGMARQFLKQDGTPPREGDQLVQAELATMLSGIRSQGAAYLHSGPVTTRFADLTAAAGMPVTANELRDTAPVFSRAVEVAFGKLGKDVAYFSPPPAANGMVAAQIWRLLTDVRNYEGARLTDRAHLLVEASKRAFSDRAAWLSPEGVSRQEPSALIADSRLEPLMASFEPERATPAMTLSPPPRAIGENPAGASFLAADRFGNAVACSVTMNGLFGSGRLAEGTGIVLAAPPSSQNNGYLSPIAVVIGNTTNGDVRFAAAASGGVAASTSLVSVMLGSALEGLNLDRVVRAARLHHGGLPDEVYYETGMSQEILEALRNRGHVLREAAVLGRVNALACPDGIRDGHQACQVVSDPRGSGLATVVQ